MSGLSSLSTYQTLRVLLVEDDDTDVLVTRRLLRDISVVRYELEVVSTYREAIGRLCRNEHDVCLLDFFLGSENGLDVLHALEQCGCRVPIIILTGKGDRDVDLSAMEAGAVDYLEKSAITSNLL